VDDLLQFDSRGNIRLFFRITQGQESDHFDRFRNLQNLFYLRFIEGADPAGSETKTRGQGHHISPCQGRIISSELSLSGIETENDDDWGLSYMGINKEEPGYLANSFSRLRVCHNDEVPGLKVCCGGSPSPCLKDLEEKILWDGFVLVDPDGPPGF